MPEKWSDPFQGWQRNTAKITSRWDWFDGCPANFPKDRIMKPRGSDFFVQRRYHDLGSQKDSPKGGLLWSSQSNTSFSNMIRIFPLMFSWLHSTILYLSYLNVWYLLLLVGGLEHEFYFPIYSECHHPNWLSYFSEGFKPPTRLYLTSKMVETCLQCCSPSVPKPCLAAWSRGHGDMISNQKFYWICSIKTLVVGIWVMMYIIIDHIL